MTVVGVVVVRCRCGGVAVAAFGVTAFRVGVVGVRRCRGSFPRVAWPWFAWPFGIVVVAPFGVTAFGVTAFGVTAFGVTAFGVTAFGVVTRKCRGADISAPYQGAPIDAR